MDRRQIIAYSLMCNGEYDQIINAIETKMEVPDNIYSQVDDISDKAITIFDEDYPKQLLNLSMPPFVLFIKGDRSLLNDEHARIAIVGSRMPTPYSIDATKLLCNQKRDKVIVSGLAKGIDTCAHDNANKTIAVLGCGIDYIYPRCNFDLFKKIEKEGLIISEYPSYTKPLGYHFPFRNRIIAALADCLYVAECKHNSGTMTSINEALKLGKDVKALPFNIFTALSNKVCNNTLINEGMELWDIEP